MKSSVNVIVDGVFYGRVEKQYDRFYAFPNGYSHGIHAHRVPFKRRGQAWEFCRVNGLGMGDELCDVEEEYEIED